MKHIRCCKDCTDRTLGCHSTCQRYLKEREEIHKDKELRRKQRIVDSYRTDRAYDSINDLVVRNIKRNRYTKKRGGW